MSGQSFLAVVITQTCNTSVLVLMLKSHTRCSVVDSAMALIFFKRYLSILLTCPTLKFDRIQDRII